MPSGRLMTLLEFIECAISGDAWLQYEQVRDISRDALTKLNADVSMSYKLAPFDDAERAQGYLERGRLENEFKLELASNIFRGACSVRGTDEHSGRSEEVDAHTLASAHIDFGDGVISLGIRRLIDVRVIASLASETPEELTDDSQRRLMEEQLRQWFADRRTRNEGPLSRRKSFRLAKQELPSRYLIEGLFDRIWEELGHPHPLKHRGRPPRDER